MIPKFPPQLTVTESIRIIKEIYTRHHSKEISLDLMPEILNISKKSSYFPSAIVALQRFGLVTKKPNDIIILTDLAIQIIDPIGDEEITAIIALFHKDEVLSVLVNKYPNGKLPSEEQLKQTLLKTLHIDRNGLKKWAQFVIESFQSYPMPTAIALSPQVKQSIPQRETLSVHNEEAFKSNLKYQNIIMPSGKQFSFNIEDGYDLDDLEFITDFLELYKKKISKNKVL